LSDCGALHELGARAGGGGDLVLLAMGEYGAPTRVLASRFGSAWSYAGPLDNIGQVTAAVLLNEYRFRQIEDSTDVYGLTGGSVAHSVSPAMLNAVFRTLRLNAVYLPMPAVSADDFLAFGKTVGIKGASVTIPHKVTLIERLDEVDADARRIGAVNTIRVDNGRWIGRNTDVNGFLAPFDGRVKLEGLRAAILGSGGAARAVASALAANGCRVTLHARSRQKAEEVAALVGAAVGGWPPPAGSWDILVNCTPIGQHPLVDDTPLPIAHLIGRYVYDLVYNPQVTRLLREAAAAGCQTIGGLEMLVAQAEAQLQWWTGCQAPPGLMREAALKRLTESASHENHVA
jgi:shikimate dehydrogenase